MLLIDMLFDCIALKRTTKPTAGSSVFVLIKVDVSKNLSGLKLKVK